MTLSTLDYINPNTRVRTEHRGIFRRGHGYSVFWRDRDGKQRWKDIRELDDALAFKALKRAERDEFRRDRQAAMRTIRIRDRADMTDARQAIWTALKVLDRSGIGTTLNRPIYAALYQAEDAVNDALNRSYDS
jgi:hypothetical protein